MRRPVYFLSDLYRKYAGVRDNDFTATVATRAPDLLLLLEDLDGVAVREEGLGGAEPGRAGADDSDVPPPLVVVAAGRH